MLPLTQEQGGGVAESVLRDAVQKSVTSEPEHLNIG